MHQFPLAKIVPLCRTLIAVLLAGASAALCSAKPVPRISGEWWQIASSPDLGELSAERQQVVDFAIWRAADGSWQLWSCIRNTKEAGKGRLLHRWEGATLGQPNWQPMGIAMRANPAIGETAGGLQAPYVVRRDGKFLMFYGDWANICSQEGTDGKTFARRLDRNGRPQLFGGSEEANVRDPMLFRLGDEWVCYYTAHPGNQGAVYARRSRDLKTWGEEIKVAPAGPDAPDARYAAECPFVVEPYPGEFLLFETQVYGRNARTTVRHSRNALNFSPAPGANNVVCTLPIAAPEIFQHEGTWYIAALRGLKGIQLAKLAWD